jgi:hypothetical protein
MNSASLAGWGKVLSFFLNWIIRGFRALARTG